MPIHPFFSFLLMQPLFGVFVAFQAHCLVKKVDTLRCTIEKSLAILCILSVSRRKRRRNNTPLHFSPCLCLRLRPTVDVPGPCTGRSIYRLFAVAFWSTTFRRRHFLHRHEWSARNRERRFPPESSGRPSLVPFWVGDTPMPDQTKQIYRSRE